MKRFISYILAVTMIISMFGSLTAIGNDEPVTTVYQAEDALIGTAGTIVSSKLSVALDSTNGLKYYVAGTDAIMAIAYDLGKISAGDIVDVTMNFNITDFGAMQQSLYILPEDIYTELSEKSIKDYYPDFESVYGDYRAAVSESLDSSNVISKTWSTDSITNVTAEMDGQLIACVTGIRNGGKLTSFVKKFDVSIISNSEGPIETNPPQATEMPTIEPTHEPTATEVPTIEPTQEPHETETPSAKPTQEPTEETTPKPEEGVTWAGSIEELTEALKINNTIIKLYKDIDLGTIGLKTSCVTYVDLNGHTLTSNTSAVIEMVHDITIVDTGSTKGALKNTNSNTSYGIKCAAKNVTLNVEGAEIDAASQAIMLNGAGSVVNLKDNAVINGGAYAINAGANGTLNIESAIINSDASYNGYAMNASGAVVTIEDGTFNYHGTMSSMTVSSTSTVTINGGTFTNPNIKRGVINNAKGYSGTLTINGGTFENTNAGGYSILDGDEATTASPPVINITGGNFKSAIGFTKPNNTTTDITITGGTFSFDPAVYIKDTEMYEKVDNGDGTYTVHGIGVEPEPTATPTVDPTTEPTATPVVEPTPTTEPTAPPAVEPTPTAGPTSTPVKPTTTPSTEPTFKPTASPDTETETIVTSAEELIAALQLNNTIVKLGADIDFGTAGLKTSRVTYIDLNGHTLTSNTSAVIEMVYDLTILDTGATKGALKNTNSSTSYGIKCAAKNVTLNVEGAEIDAASQAIMLNGANSVVNLKGNAVINGGAHAINAGANGTLNIESAVINSDESYKGYVFSASGAVVTIENGTFNYNGTMSSIVVSGKSNITINGGAFTNPNSKRGVINNAKGYSGTLTINGGTFENTNSGGYSILDGDEATTATPPVINITGGNFKSAIGFTKPNNTTTEIIITGGSFIFDPKQYIDENIYAAVNKDGMYTVVDKSEITETPKPSATPIPTAPPNPTDIPKPTVTPNSTNTPKPTVTPEPSDTPKPTVTPGPAGTPKPVATPKPTETVTPQATPTGMPTFTPVVKPTSKPSIWGPDEPVISNASSGGGGGGGISSAPLPPLVPKATSKPEIDISDLKGDTAEITKATQYPIVDSNDAWFTDVFENQWYYDYVKYAVDNGLMSGMSDTEFGSEINIQRCMFVTVLYRMDGEPDSTEDIVFTDVPENAYFKKAVSWANTNGIVSGYSDDEFAPDENITREQLATIIWRYARYKGIDISSENDNALNYDDTREISDYAIPAMKWIIGVGIIGGFDDNTLRPKDNTTRAQTATILKKFNDVYNVIK